MKKKQKIKWIISDMDGTLINNDNYNLLMDEKTSKLINSLEKKQCYFTVATGRHYIDALKICNINKIKFNNKNNFIIGLNGGHIFSINDQKLIYENYIERNNYDEIIRLFNLLKDQKENCLAMIYSENLHIFLFDINSSNFDEESKKAKNFECNEDLFKYEKINNLNNINKILKICVIFEKKDLNLIFFCENNGRLFKTINLLKSSDDTIEIVPKESSKGNAISFLNDNFLKLNKNQILTLGDSQNDISMFLYSTHSATRSCANPKIKEVATHIFNNGPSKFVAEAIDYFLEKKD